MGSIAGVDGSAPPRHDIEAADLSGQIPGLRKRDKAPMAGRIAYKVMSADEFARMRREHEFHGSAADIADGFIHLSTAEQLAATVDKHFHGQAGLVVAAIDLSCLRDTVKWEPSRGGELFPHVHGVLPMAAVVADCPLERRTDGSVKLPD